MENNSERLTYNVVEASRILGLSKNATYQGVLRNEIPHIKVGKRILIPRIAILKMMSEAGNSKAIRG